MARTGKRRVYRLTERVCQQARPGKHGDGFGLYLRVRRNGSRAFVQRLVVNGRRVDIGLGPFPIVTWPTPRPGSGESATQTSGHRPAGPSSSEEGSANRPRAPRQGHRGAERSWRGAQTEASWRRCFQQYVFPVAGDTPVDLVTIEQVTRIVEPHWQGRGSAGYLVRQRLDVLFRRAVVLKYRSDNPAHQLLDVLAAVRREPAHHPSVPHPQVRSALEDLRASSAPEVVKDVLVFIVLTAARLSEATGALWSEIDGDKAIWSLPAARMKAGHKHDVPLSAQALSILHRVRAHGDPAFVFRFRASNGKARPVSGESLELLDAQARAARQRWPLCCRAWLPRQLPQLGSRGCAGAR